MGGRWQGSEAFLLTRRDRDRRRRSNAVEYPMHLGQIQRVADVSRQSDSGDCDNRATNSRLPFAISVIALQGGYDGVLNAIPGSCNVVNARAWLDKHLDHPPLFIKRLAVFQFGTR